MNLRNSSISSLVWLAFAAPAILTACSDETDAPASPRSDAPSGMVAFSIASTTGSRSDASEPQSVGFITLRSEDGTDSLFLRAEIMENPTVMDMPSSRGAELNTSNLDDFAATCVLSKAGTPGYTYFTNQRYDKPQSGDVWTGNIYYWMESYQHDFYLTAPDGAAPINYADGKATIDYTVNSAVNQQVDLLGYTGMNADYGQKVNVTFNHLLTRVSVVQGTDMAQVTLRDIKMTGLHTSGTYNLTDGAWTGVEDSPTADYLLANSVVASDGASVTGDGNYLFLMPQTIPDDAAISLSVDLNGTTKTYSAQLKQYGTTAYAPGKSVRYTITVKPQMDIEITEDDCTQDAHYILMKDGKVKVNIAGLPAGKTATLKISTDNPINGEVPTIQLNGDLNTFAKQGFWTDYKIENNNQISARGTDQITGLTNTSGTEIAVFIPENNSEADRTITLSLIYEGKTIGEKKIKQLHPHWVGNYGWEQTEDNIHSKFGFYGWTRNVCLTYKYSVGTLWVNTNSDQYKYVVGIQSGYTGFKTWTFIKTFYNTLRMNYRAYIQLDYSLLTDLTGCNSRNDGLANTKWLNDYGGEAATMSMEHSILSIKKNDNSGETAFRIPSVADDGNNAPASDLSSIDVSNIALAQVLKKNKYYLKNTAEAGEGEVGLVAIIASLDWYIPAVDQFDTWVAPVNNADMIPANCWASTATGSTDAYIGDKNQISRDTEKFIRACRNK